MRTVAVLATVGAARAAAAPDRVAWGARRRAAPALEAEAVPRQDAPRAADDGAPPLPPLPAEAIVEALIAARPA